MYVAGRGRHGTRTWNASTTITDRTVSLGRALQAHGVSRLAVGDHRRDPCDHRDRPARRAPSCRDALRTTLVKDARHRAAVRRASSIATSRPPPAPTTRMATMTDRPTSSRPWRPERGLARCRCVTRRRARRARRRAPHREAPCPASVPRRRHRSPDVAGADRRSERHPGAAPRPDRRAEAADRADVRAQLESGVDAGIAPDVQDIEFLEASRAELDQMRPAIRPIARKLAARLARKRRHRVGRANFRRTDRRSLATGGVPLDVAHERATRPQARTLRAVRHLRFGRRLLALHAHADGRAVRRDRSDAFVRLRRCRRRGHRSARARPAMRSNRGS